jgi:FkbM family methyltransferase
MELPQDFRAAVLRHGARLVPGHDNSFVLSDTPARKAAWQIFELPNRNVARATIRLQLSMRPIDGGAAMLALHQLPGVTIAMIGRDGSLVKSEAGALKAHSVDRREDGWLNLDLLYVNKGPSIVVGLAKPGSRYIGTNTPQIELKDLKIEVVEPRWTPSPSDPLRIVETGLRTIADVAWQPFAEGLNIASFTPFADQLEGLRTVLPASPGHLVMGKALSDRNGTSPFYVTQNKAFSSILKPDFQRLKSYPSADDYQIASEVRIETCRFDSLVTQGLAAAPDVIRLEASGLEYNALRGMGALLDGVMAVETSLYLYPVYKKQKLMADIVDLLESSGLVLFRLVPSVQNAAQFGRETVKMTGIFLRKRPAAEAVGRYQLLEEIWALPSSF